MIIRATCLLLLAGLGAPPAARALTVTVEHAAPADFSRYRTYAWRPGTAAPNPEVEHLIRAEIDARLAARKLRRETSEADFFVLTYAARDRLFGIGLLRVDIVDSRTLRVVWRVRAGAEATEDPKKVRKLVKKAVREIFAQFPIAVPARPAPRGPARPGQRPSPGG